MLIQNGDILRVSFYQRLYERCLVNSLRWQVTDTKGNESPLAIRSAANDFMDYLGQSWRDNRSVAWALTKVRLYNETTNFHLAESNLQEISGLVPEVPSLGRLPAVAMAVVLFRQQGVYFDQNRVVNNWTGFSGWDVSASTYGRLRNFTLWQLTKDSLQLPAVLEFSDWNVRPVLKFQTSLMLDPVYPIVTAVWISANVRTRRRRKLK